MLTSYMTSHQDGQEARMHIWPVQDAKARFSEFLDTCLEDGPQIVSRRGTEAAVLVPIDQWRKTAGRQPADAERPAAVRHRSRRPRYPGTRQPPPPGAGSASARSLRCICSIPTSSPSCANAARTPPSSTGCGVCRRTTCTSCALTLGELQAGVEVTRAQDAEKAEEIEFWIDQVANTWNVLPMDARVMRAWARLMVGQHETN